MTSLQTEEAEKMACKPRPDKKRVQVIIQSWKKGLLAREKLISQNRNGRNDFLAKVVQDVEGQ